MKDKNMHEPTASPALTQILTAQAWRNERLLNGFRVAIWTAVGAITGGAEIYSSTSISPGAVLAMVWGLVAAISGFTWLKRFYRHSVAVLLTSVDITVIALCMHAVLNEFFTEMARAAHAVSHPSWLAQY